MTRFGPKMGQNGPKLDKSGTFSHQISVHCSAEVSGTFSVPDLSHLGPIRPILGPNLVTVPRGE